MEMLTVSLRQYLFDGSHFRLGLEEPQILDI